MSPFLFIILMLVVQYFFSTRNHVYWGAILPIVYIILLTWLFINNSIEHTIAYSIYLIVGLIFLIEEWYRGRKSLHNKRKKEIEKIKTKNLK